MNFDALIKDIQDNHWNVHGMEIYEDGRLIHQYGHTIGARFPIYSATKTITSIAAGMAWDQGKIDLEQSVLAYLPSETVSQMPAEQIAAFREVTVRRLLTMSVSSFPFRPQGESYLNFSLACPIPDVQARTFHYSNIPAYLVGVALTQAVSEDLFQYLKMSRRIFLRSFRHGIIRTRFKPDRPAALSRRGL